jgi:hypothetical protein
MAIGAAFTDAVATGATVGMDRIGAETSGAETIGAETIGTAGPAADCEGGLPTGGMVGAVSEGMLPWESSPTVSPAEMIGPAAWPEAGVCCCSSRELGRVLSVGICNLAPQNGQIPLRPAWNSLTFSLCPFGQ